MIVKRSRLKMLLMSAGCMAAAWGCSYIASDLVGLVGERTAGKANFGFWIFSILAAFALLATLFARTVIAEITPQGIKAPGLNSSLIEWQDIASLDVVSQAGSETVMLNVVPGSHACQSMKTSARTVAAAGNATGFPGYSIPLGTSGVSGQQFMAAVAQNRARQPLSGNGFGQSFRPAAAGFGGGASRGTFGQRG
jgi:hypothetical protein